MKTGSLHLRKKLSLLNFFFEKLINFVNHTIMDQESVEMEGIILLVLHSLTTAENKMKKEIGNEKDNITKKEARATFFTRGKVDND
jgi:hypothetical protein